MRLATPLVLLIALACRTDKDFFEDWEDEQIPVEEEIDADRDGWIEGEDCNDSEAAIHPGASEICDGLDNNCDGEIDEGVMTTFYTDADGDGFGNGESPVEACSQPSGAVPNGSDCDDDDADAWPGASERCDNVDNDCDGEIDEDVLDTWYADVDGDGFGDAESELEDCNPPSGYVDDDTDCDDSTEAVWPGATEICDERDNDCDGEVDEGVTTTFYADADGDGWGLEEDTVEDCDEPSGYAEQDGDCDDANAEVSPGADELCDSIDNDCDTLVDEDDAVDAGTWYLDADGDGYGDADNSYVSCDTPIGYGSDATDCDDSNGAVNPDATEICDEIDNDCDGDIDDDDASLSDASTWYLDWDGDGYGGTTYTATSCEALEGYVEDASDCDDADADINPDARESCDEQDNDCDGDVDEEVTTTFYADEDGDGWGVEDDTTEDCDVPRGYAEEAGDCDDDDDAISPDADELCDEVDNDCDGDVDEDDATDTATWYADADGDGYGDSSRTTESCDLPSGYVDDDTDCDDSDATVSPGAAEVCDEVDNDCDGDIDDDDSSLEDGSTWYLDWDGDGYGGSTYSTTRCEALSGYVEDSSDCDDADSDISPDATEVCDEVDNDCDGDVDDDDASLRGASTWVIDYDEDGFGDADESYTAEACEAPRGYVEGSEDCDDSDEDINPDATEVCDEVDNDCDGDIDDADSSLDTSTGETFYTDADGDGYGDASSSSLACEAPSDMTSDDTDCDDSDADISPDAEEVCDEVDNDCDGSVDEDASDETTWYLDYDEDGYGDADHSSSSCDAPTALYVEDSTDCDDNDEDIHPGADEGCDGGDYDCDGAVDNDADGDGYADDSCGGDDCDDSDASIYPESTGECALGEDCLDILDGGLSSGDGFYTVDPDGYGSGEDPETVYCDMSTDGGGWTLVATNADDGWWDATEVVTETVLGSVDLEADYKALAWSTVTFTDLMFEDGDDYAIYGGMGDDSQSYYDFQADVPHRNCGSTDGYRWAMTEGSFSGGYLCDRYLYIHPIDEDGGSNTSCSESYYWADNSSGPTWSASNNNGCPLDDPSSSNFYSYGSRVPWSTSDPLRMWVR